MIRATVALLTIISAVIWLPVWAQLGLFVVAILLVKYRLVMLIPAIFADALYAPTVHLSIFNFKMTIFVLTLLLIYWLVITQTRIGVLYAEQI